MGPGRRGNEEGAGPGREGRTRCKSTQAFCGRSSGEGTGIGVTTSALSVAEAIHRDSRPLTEASQVRVSARVSVQGGGGLNAPQNVL